QPVGGAQLCATNGAMVVRMEKATDFILSPPFNFDALENSVVAVRMSTTSGRRGRILFATDKAHGLHWLDFPITADGRQRVYNVAMRESGDWQGRVLALGLRPTDALESPATVRSIAIGREPQGPPQLVLRAFALDDAAPRVGVHARITAIVSNAGGTTASNVQFQLSLPAGLRLVGTNGQTTLLRRLGIGEETTLSWQVVADRSLTNEIRSRVTADGAEQATACESLQIPARKPLALAANESYVPRPKPVRGRIDVGVYYFPGWRDVSKWTPILRFPERKPVLGWYREGSPEVADWHIKWAVEHGITFFACDWYWVKGGRQLEHALHDGFFHARYRHLLKFCLLWANHNPPNTHSLDDSVAVARFWITNYFNRPEYYQIAGKPVIIIFSPYSFRSDLGADGTRQSLNAMREECRRAGLNGLYIVACVSGPHEVEDEGYDAVTCYNWAGLGLIGAEKQGPFSALIEGYHRKWETFIEQSRLPIMLPISGGWDSRPWHGNNAMVRDGRTPGLFKRHLQEARDVLERCVGKTNLLPAVIIEAWNEWGEGSYIEPHKEFGFGYLDAVRDVFTAAPAEHEDLVPHNVGIGPYDVPL
ncbi:MAG: glycoside hydrolase family 99-like domain-containing protein, partial [Verrucomicrobiia bacterium]